MVTHVFEHVPEDAFCVRPLTICEARSSSRTTTGARCGTRTGGTCEHIREVGEEVGRGVRVCGSLVESARRAQRIILPPARCIGKNVVRICDRLHMDVSDKGQMLGKMEMDVGLAWNFSVARFTSAGGLLASLSGWDLRLSFLYACRISSWDAVC